MSSQEQQQEELEVLHSIYDGDSNFKKVSPTSFQYKYGVDGDYRSFVVELNWGENYPDEPPSLNMDLFYNRHLVKPVKDKITEGLQSQMEQYAGMQMTFSLFDWVKDSLNELLQEQPAAPPVAQAEQAEACAREPEEETKKKERKEQMTKAQKRRHFDKYGASQERPRGWNWVDIVKHLSQTGSQNPSDS